MADGNPYMKLTLYLYSNRENTELEWHPITEKIAESEWHFSGNNT